MITVSIKKIILIFIFLIFSCSSEEKKIPTLQVNSGGTLKIMLSAAVENFDPQKLMFLSDWQMSSLIYEGLVSYHSQSDSLIPFLAESWQKLDSGHRYIFKIRNDVYFQDDPCFPQGEGRKLTAKDIVYTFKRIANPETGNNNYYLFANKIQGINEFHQQQSDSITGIRILDQNCIEVKLTKPYITFLKLLATPICYIVPREAIEYYGDNFYQHPVGTGPFRLARWKELQEILLVRNDNYWRTSKNYEKLPFLDAVLCRYISDPTIALSEFLKGELNLIIANQSAYHKLRSDEHFIANHRLALVSPEYAFRFLGFSLDKNSAISRYASLRQALAVGFNRAFLLENLLNNELEPAHSIVPALLFPFINQKWYAFNPEQAKELLAEHPEFDKNITILTNFDSKGVQLFKENLLNLGIHTVVRIQAVQYYQHIVNDRPDVFRVSFHPAFPDPEEYYSLFYSKSAAPINLTAYHNPVYDRIYEQAQVEQDYKKREMLFLQLEKILYQDVPAIYLNHGEPKNVLTNQYVHGLETHFGILDFTTVWLERPNDPKK